MKRTGLLVVAISMVVALTACKKKTKEKSDEGAKPAPMAGMDMEPMAGMDMEPMAGMAMTPPPKRKTPFEQAVEDLASKDVKKRRAAITVLGKNNDKKVVPHLIKALGDADLLVVHNSLYNLMGRKDPRAVAPAIALFDSAMVTGLKDKNARWEIRLNCMKLLSRVPTPDAVAALKKWTKNKDKDVAKFAKGALKTAKAFAKDMKK